MPVRSRKTVPVLLVLLLAVAAALGYELGRHRVASVPVAAASGAAGVASGSDVLLEYPRGWAPARSVPSIAGLTLSNAIALKPEGRGAEAALVSGLLPAGEPGPLPESLLERLPAEPQPEITDLIAGQAYRYAGLRVRGLRGELVVYVLPEGGSGTTALACYAAPGYASYIAQCERIVAGLTLQVQGATELSPSASYAANVSALIAALQGERKRSRAALSESTVPADADQLATTLAASFQHAASALAQVEAPAPATSAQSALVQSLQRAGEAYATLASAVQEDSLSSYEAARAHVSEAESGVDKALGAYTLLGYSSP